MAKTINSKWANKMVEKIRNGWEIDVVLTENIAAKWLIAELAKSSTSFQIINLGGGVKRITTDTKVCPKCNGTGEC